MSLKAPFPYFGGKSRIASMVWERFGDVANYVEPFAGSLAVLLGRPHQPGIETVNDKDCYIANFWRALQADPAAVALQADWPVNETDLYARHKWLVAQSANGLRERLENDPEWYDAKIAAWWVWGISCWIGSGWCNAPENGARVENYRQRPHLTGGMGIHRQVPNLITAGKGINRQVPHLGDGGMGIHRRLPKLLDAGNGVHQGARQCDGALQAYFQDLAERLRRVRVCCGDWTRIVTPPVTRVNGVTAVFLDPPYSEEAGRDSEIYASEDLTVARAVRDWAVAQGSDPMLRIALCGYEGEHKIPDSWECVAWKAHGGYGSHGRGKARDNGARERVWFSPHCLKQTQMEWPIYEEAI